MGRRLLFLIALAALLLLFLAIVQQRDQQQQNAFIAATELTINGGKLYAQTALHDDLITQIRDLLARGEPIRLTYHFRVLHQRDWLPDKLLAETTVTRRLQLHKITQRYEMRESVDQEQPKLLYESDPDSALRFLTHPRFIALGEPPQGVEKLTAALPGGPHSYRFETRVTREREGLSRMFRVLFRWLSLGQREDHLMIRRYRAA
ncbi:hypothetical protein MAIT1_00036 [Magnetofaba australis IT-1]|uniref:DUF4390 domain-containing protein n=2 Tax=Magnetofaba TaxID=1472292 RepID=A0A1Y2K8P4_9PROT|nr:hypothetical protein MAIT1_00036 [Magnetofaba australis IT-1]